MLAGVGKLGIRGIGGRTYIAPTAASLLDGELFGFALDFCLNSYAIKTTSNAELIQLQLGDEWNGLALDFTTNLELMRISTGAEELMGPGPDDQENYAVGLDFTDNTSALRY